MIMVEPQQQESGGPVKGSDDDGSGDLVANQGNSDALQAGRASRLRSWRIWALVIGALLLVGGWSTAVAFRSAEIDQRDEASSARTEAAQLSARLQEVTAERDKEKSRADALQSR